MKPQVKLKVKLTMNPHMELRMKLSMKLKMKAKAKTSPVKNLSRIPPNPKAKRRSSLPPPLDHCNTKCEQDVGRPERLIPLIPMREEIEGRPYIIPFLVVGLMIAENIFKYGTDTSTTTRNVQAEKVRAELPVMASNTGFLRAVVPIAENIEQSQSSS